MGPADAFVLTYAISGVLRAYVAMEEEPASRKDVEDALVRLALRFVGIEEVRGAARPAAAATPAARPRKSPAASPARAGKSAR